MVAAWLKSAPLMLKATPVAKKQRPHRQNVFSQHQNASTVPTRPPGLRNFARGSLFYFFIDNRFGTINYWAVGVILFSAV
jgi:hypothetical protein